MSDTKWHWGRKGRRTLKQWHTSSQPTLPWQEWTSWKTHACLPGDPALCAPSGWDIHEGQVMKKSQSQVHWYNWKGMGQVYHIKCQMRVNIMQYHVILYVWSREMHCQQGNECSIKIIIIRGRVRGSMKNSCTHSQHIIPLLEIYHRLTRGSQGLNSLAGISKRLLHITRHTRTIFAVMPTASLNPFVGRNLLTIIIIGWNAQEEQGRGLTLAP